MKIIYEGSKISNYGKNEDEMYRFEEDYFKLLYAKKDAVGFDSNDNKVFEIINGRENIRTYLFTPFPARFKTPTKFQVKGFLKLFKSLASVRRITCLTEDAITKWNNGGSKIDFWKWNFLVSIKNLVNIDEDINDFYNE